MYRYTLGIKFNRRQAFYDISENFKTRKEASKEANNLLDGTVSYAENSGSGYRQSDAS